MSNRGDSAFLADIREAIRRITIYIEDLGYETYLTDTKTQDAIVRNLEIIGEAVKNISDDGCVQNFRRDFRSAQLCHFERRMSEKSLQTPLGSRLFRDFSSYLLEMTCDLPKISDRPSDDLKLRHDDIPWKGLAGVRDKLIHHYFGVNFDIVWNIITEELPHITEKLDNISIDEDD